MPKDEIPDLRQKLAFLVTDGKPQSVSRKTTGKNILSIKALAGTISVSHTNFYPESGRLSDRVQAGLQRIYGICPRSECWSEFAAGDVTEFKKEYIENYHEVFGAAKNWFTDEKKIVLLSEDVFAIGEIFQTDLATLRLRFSQREPIPGEITLSLDLNCPAWMVEDDLTGVTHPTGVKHCILGFWCGTGRTTVASERTGYPDGYTVEGAKFSLHSVAPNTPSWRVDSLTGNAIGLIGKVSDTFIRITNIFPGDTISADIRAWDKDIQGTFALPSGPDASLVKRRIKDRLRRMTLRRGDDDKAILAGTQMKLKAMEA